MGADSPQWRRELQKDHRRVSESLREKYYRHWNPGPSFRAGLMEFFQADGEIRFPTYL
jgi:hypothetical protein